MSSAVEPQVAPPIRDPWTLPGRGSARKPRLLLLITEDWYFRSHRLDLAKAAQRAGMDVCVVTNAPDGGEWIRREGLDFRAIPFQRGSLNPAKELSAVLRLAWLYRKERPDIVHHVAMKPVLYGSWAARLAGIPAVVNAFGGLGVAFTAPGWRTQLLRAGLTAGLRTALSLPNSRVIFQHEHDRDLMIQEEIVRAEDTLVIRGVGVDGEHFPSLPEQPGPLVVLLASRMLWPKGIGEFIEAARALSQRNIAARFVLVGRTDPANPASIDRSQLRAWQSEGLVEWWGHRDDMPAVLNSAHVVVLPTTYGEGIPKILLEAAACGRPIVATDVPGCRDVVRHGVNGLLVPPRDPTSLAKAIEQLMGNATLRQEMGSRGRTLALGEFSAAKMANQTIALYRTLLPSPSAAGAVAEA